MPCVCLFTPLIGHTFSAKSITPFSRTVLALSVPNSPDRTFSLVVRSVLTYPGLTAPSSRARSHLPHMQGCSFLSVATVLPPRMSSALSHIDRAFVSYLDRTFPSIALGPHLTSFSVRLVVTYSQIRSYISWSSLAPSSRLAEPSLCTHTGSLPLSMSVGHSLAYRSLLRFHVVPLLPPCPAPDRTFPAIGMCSFPIIFPSSSVF